ncbi:MAG: GAF domain-containing protein [Chitinophagaceae bacterium]|nr:MAG: GAF domain-containing protein [Chitinophagaceae bacterium]
MNFRYGFESPLQIQFSFGKMIDRLRVKLESAGTAGRQQILHDLSAFDQLPELRTGISDLTLINQHEDLIRRLFEDYFPPALTNNEIKAVSFPYSPLSFNYTRRFRGLLDAAGPGFEFSIRDLGQHQFYVLSCCIILNDQYGTALDFATPLFYDIPAANGVTRHYRLLYNADDLEIIATEKAVSLTEAEIAELIENYYDLNLWKSKFPPDSYILSGFALMTLVDVTVENAISIFKETLLSLQDSDFQQSVESIFRSIFRHPDIEVGFSVFEEAEQKLATAGGGYQLKSFLVNNLVSEDVRNILCRPSYDTLIIQQKYFSIADVAAYALKYPESELIGMIKEHAPGSLILAPVIKNNHFFGVLELIAKNANELNSVNANKLDVIMPFFTDTIERLTAQFADRVQAIIQTNYTSLHPSVYWKFRMAASQVVMDSNIKPALLPEIIFDGVYPLYGQVDIKGSSEARNESTRKDLRSQLSVLMELITPLRAVKTAGADFDSAARQIEMFMAELEFPVNAGTEQDMIRYLEQYVHGPLDQYPGHVEPAKIVAYFRETIKSTGKFHYHRRMYDQTVNSINNMFAMVLDEQQIAAQEIIPHYFERFKTDGVDFSLYCGTSINPAKNFTPAKLARLRIWQLETLCKMERVHYLNNQQLPFQLEVTTLLLIYSIPISIRFRMDEKRFDVDGSYNARFETLKKRIDKAYIKGSATRLTEPGLLSLVYSDQQEAKAYRGYLARLQEQGFLEPDIEIVDVDDLQGVTGLKAYRVRFRRDKPDTQ